MPVLPAVRLGAVETVSPWPSRDAARRAYRTRSLLAAHVPLSLLLDIADAGGPDSRHLLDTEPGSTDWLSGVPRTG